MKLHTFARHAVLSVLPIALLFACDSGGTKATPDTTITPDTRTSEDVAATETTPEDTTVEVDTATTLDTTTSPDTTPPDTTVNGCDRTSFVSVASAFTSSTGTTVIELRSASETPTDVLQIELYSGGDYTGATTIGMYSLDGSTYEDCSNCVVARTNCTAQGCEKRFLVDVGDLEITQWDFAGGLFKAKLIGAKAHEVSINETTYVSTLVPGGETWCLDGIEFEAPIAALPMSDRTQPGCVAAGTGNVLHDNIANVQFTDCNGRRVKLHATCDDPTQKALWIVGTAGWCTACHEFLTNFVAEHGGSLSRARVGEVTPGLDMLIVLGENAQGTKPSEAYCKAYAQDLGIDPSMVVIDWSDTPVPLPVVNEPGMAIETQSLGTIWTAMDPYLYSENGGVSVYYPWWALLRPSNMEYVWSDRAALQDFETTLGTLLSE